MGRWGERFFSRSISPSPQHFLRAMCVQLSFPIATETALTDAALVLKSQRGDRAAFEELVRLTARMVFAAIYLETGDIHRTEDLVQDTFLVAWRSIKQVHDPDGFRSWLFSVAHSVVIDSARRDGRKKRFARRADSQELLRLVDSQPQPPEVAQQHEARQEVLALLRSLPGDYRQPLMLRYIGGADYQTISRELGLSDGSLRGLLGRGLAMLRQQMMRKQP